MTLNELKELLLIVGVPVYHYEGFQETGNYIVWAEDSQGSASYSDDSMSNRTIQGTIDYFTQEENDKIVEVIEEKLNSADLSWQLGSIQHEKETGYIHYEWIWEVDNIGTS